MSKTENSYKQILKSTSIVGGSQLFIILINIVKTKFVAVLLGPSGVGIVGMYQSVIDIIRNTTGFGINFSGVKDIAEAYATGHYEHIGKSLKTLRFWAWITGLLGLTLMILLSYPLSYHIFGSYDYVLGIVLLSVVPLVTSISAGQIAVLQGTRELKSMAKANLVGAFIGLIVSVALYWFMGIEGIVFVLIATSFIALAASWYYSRTIRYDATNLSVKLLFRNGLGMAKVGFFIVVSGLLSVFTLYLVRIIIIRQAGIDSVGYFQASWTITNLYVNLILNSMLADFYPRLAAINSGNEGSVQLVNEQMEISILIGMPFVISLMTFSKFVVNVLYTNSFLPTVNVLIWQLSGSLFTFVMWTLGVVFLARGNGKLVIITDFLWNLVFLGGIFYGWDKIGFNVIGVAFVVAGFVKLVIVFYFVRKIIFFRFSRDIVYLIFIYSTITVLLTYVLLAYSGSLPFLFGIAMMLLSGAVSLFFLNKKFSLKELSGNIRKHFVRK